MRLRAMLVMAMAAPWLMAQTVAVRGVDTPWTFPEVHGPADWAARAKEMREEILFHAGLWPPPPKSPLNPQIFGRIERPTYTVEKVYFESLPGFYVTGNLYRPR